MAKYTKINANDYEDGVVIFKKVTNGEDHVFQRMTAAELQTELGAIDPNNYDANTFLFIKDDGSGTNNIVSPQSAAEIKTLLGVATGKYKLRFQVTTSDEDVVSLAKSVPVVNTASFTTTFAKTTTGTYTITIPVSNTYKRLVNFFFETNVGADYVLRWYTSASAIITVYLYKDGVLSDPANDSAVYFYLDLEWY